MSLVTNTFRYGYFENLSKFEDTNITRIGTLPRIVKTCRVDIPRLRTLDACVDKVKEVVDGLELGQQRALHFVFLDDGKEEHTTAVVNLDTTKKISNLTLKLIPLENTQVFGVEGQFGAGELNIKPPFFNDCGFEGDESRNLEISEMFSKYICVSLIGTPSPSADSESTFKQYHARSLDGRLLLTDFERRVGSIVKERFTVLRRKREAELNKSLRATTLFVASILFGLAAFSLRAKAS